MADVLAGVTPVLPGWWKEACEELSKRDEKMAELINVYSHAALTSVQDPFGTLIRSVIGQQISTKAAQTIWRNFAAACPEMTPQRVAKKHRRTLRSCGLSERKIDYILDICRYFLEEKITFELLEGMSEQEIIDCLTSIKGVGRWTAEMFLIFTLGRQNVFPVADLGIIKAIEKLYFSAEELQALDAQQKQIKILKLSENWAPYKTAASWFLWRSLNNSPVRY